MTKPIEFTTEFPTVPGDYWFYGDANHGSMGCNYFDESHEHYGPPKIEFSIVHVVRISNGLMVYCGSEFIYNRKFSKENHIDGYYGKFSVEPVVYPDVPDITDCKR